MRYVQITKIAPVEGRGALTPTWDNYQFGAANPISSLPRDYTLTGFLLDLPSIGNRLRMLRDTRNGIAALGFFESTPITNIVGGLIHSRNSVYLLAQSEITPNELLAKLEMWRSLCAPLSEGTQLRTLRRCFASVISTT